MMGRGNGWNRWIVDKITKLLEEYESRGDLGHWLGSGQDHKTSGRV